MGRGYCWSEEREKDAAAAAKKQALDEAYARGGIDEYNKVKSEYNSGRRGAGIGYVAGMASGAAIGSAIFPVVGTIFGAAAGAVLGAIAGGSDKTPGDNVKRVGKAVAGHIAGSILTKKDLG